MSSDSSSGDEGVPNSPRDPSTPRKQWEKSGTPGSARSAVKVWGRPENESSARSIIKEVRGEAPLRDVAEKVSSSPKAPSKIAAKAEEIAKAGRKRRDTIAGAQDTKPRWKTGLTRQRSATASTKHIPGVGPG